MDAPPPLSALVICKNEERRIGACLDALSFCDERLVIDSGSSDRTLEIVREKGARLVERPYVSQNDQKDFGRSIARGRWLLVVDADEVVSPELAKEVRAVADRDSEGPFAAYRVPFRNYFRSVWVRRCGYYPDEHVRLLRVDRARFDKAAAVHDRVLVDGALGRLSGHIDHYSFDSIADFIDKSCRYADAFARDAHGRGRRAGPATILSHTLFRFFRAYVLRGGWLEGGLGLVVSGLQAYEVFQRYARLWELGRFGGSEEGPGRGST